MRKIWLVIDSEMHSHEAIQCDRAFSTEQLAQTALDELLEEYEIPQDESTYFIMSLYVV